MRTPCLVAITRDVGTGLAACELSYVSRTAIDIGLAAAQHHAYQKVLAELGCRVIALPALPDQPDAVFVEDVAVVLDEVAILTRPGAKARRGESASIAEVLMHQRPLQAIEAPGTLDGGDVLQVERTLFVGHAARSNADGIAQLRGLVDAYGYNVVAVPTHGCLHLKSAVTLVADATLLLQPAWVDASVFAAYRMIEVDPGEGHAANALRVGAGLIHPDCFPRTRRRLEAAGIAVSTVDVSELQKAEGAVTCCSLVFADSQ